MARQPGFRCEGDAPGGDTPVVGGARTGRPGRSRAGRPLSGACARSPRAARRAEPPAQNPPVGQRRGLVIHRAYQEESTKTTTFFGDAFSVKPCKTGAERVEDGIKKRHLGRSLGCLPAVWLAAARGVHSRGYNRCGDRFPLGLVMLW